MCAVPRTAVFCNAFVIVVVIIIIVVVVVVIIIIIIKTQHQFSRL
jgi:hypothetical protein